MAPKWILFSSTIIGGLVLLLTNVTQLYSGDLPPQVVTWVNIILPSLLMLKRYMGDQLTGPNAGQQAPLTALPPSTDTKIVALQEQHAAIPAQIVALKNAA